MQKIGIFDSGIGGITVLKELKELFPHVDMVYLGDCARLPYGTKSPKTIIRYSEQCARFLVSKGIELLVVACNTASAHAIEALNAEFNIPVLGVIEAGASAAVATGAQKIGVLGTSSTIGSQAYVTTIKAIAPQSEVFSQACPLFVPLVEEGWFDDAVTEEIATRYLKPLKDSNVETLVLGCTHYPLLKKVLGRIMGAHVPIVDSAQSVATTVKRLYGEQFTCQGEGELTFYLSDTNPRFVELGEIFLGQKMKSVSEVDLHV